MGVGTTRESQLWTAMRYSISIGTVYQSKSQPIPRKLMMVVEGIRIIATSLALPKSSSHNSGRAHGGCGDHGAETSGRTMFDLIVASISATLSRHPSCIRISGSITMLQTTHNSTSLLESLTSRGTNMWSNSALRFRFMSGGQGGFPRANR